ncbi:hypothetical protein [Saccharothrix coeruleofusca]|uniref:Uncharacterized protein n=1 Tax=Saccharothrix coeruleofusca TaxID=33919 RepID=A0A918AKG5_9PSEU|nr:hypothetical protein [Saccharothrix coeruleofusca]MBP2336551.1 hypothetical protein [Saccharothrix coeruleofusca]GGP52214.1 hypothetical protein GCM10010185_25380 [Saccharothrix coeruleofusca]
MTVSLRRAAGSAVALVLAAGEAADRRRLFAVTHVEPDSSPTLRVVSDPLL